MTRSAVDAETQGLRVEAGTGEYRRAAGYLRYGSWLAELGDYRVYAERFERDGFDGRFEHLQTGWRLDGAAGSGQFTFQGAVRDKDLVDGAPRVNTFNVHHRGGEVLAGWLRSSVSSAVVDIRTLTPETAVELWSVYAQDEIHFRADSLRLIVGAKVDHYDSTGYAVQPTARTLWQLNEQNTLWGAVSRAMRKPSPLELNGRLTQETVFQGMPARVVVSGNADLGYERLDAYELGWRWRPRQQLSLDLALFQHEYQDLVVGQFGTPGFDPGPPPVGILPVQFINRNVARSRGAELAADWIVNSRLRLQAGGDWFRLEGVSGGNVLFSYDGVDPRFSSLLRARIDLPHRLELDVGWRYVDEIPAFALPGYGTVNVRLGWRIGPVELSLAVDNLFDREHVEFLDEGHTVPGLRVRRSVFGQIAWQP